MSHATLRRNPEACLTECIDCCVPFHSMIEEVKNVYKEIFKDSNVYILILSRNVHKFCICYHCPSINSDKVYMIGLITWLRLTEECIQL